MPEFMGFVNYYLFVLMFIHAVYRSDTINILTLSKNFTKKLKVRKNDDNLTYGKRLYIILNNF